MKSFRLLPAVAILALAFLFTLAVSSATAGSLGNGAAQRSKLVIDSVDATAGTVVLKSMIDPKNIHTYKIDAATRIIVGGRNQAGDKPTIDQIKVGQKVANYAVNSAQTPGGVQTLRMIYVSQ